MAEGTLARVPFQYPEAGPPGAPNPQQPSNREPSHTTIKESHPWLPENDQHPSTKVPPAGPER
jgi:hypothetical protein